MTEFSSSNNPALPPNTDLGKSPTPPPEIDNENDKENIHPIAAKTTASSKVKPSSCVFVASLRASESDDNLCRAVTAHFSKFGSLISVKVLRDPANRPYAFVQYTNDDDCRNAIEQGHNSILSGRRLRCEAAKVNRTLFLAATNPMSLLEVEKKMSEYGETELIVASSGNGQLISDLLSVATSNLNWFVKYCYRDDAIRAFASITEDEEFSVEWAKNIDDTSNDAPKIDKLSIYVGQLASDITESDLRNHFSANGEIEEVTIKAKPNSAFAFISFRLEEAAASAVARENHSMFMNKTIHVQYKEVSSRNITRVILSPRTPIALAPPPINVRRRHVPFEAANIPHDRFGRWERNNGAGYKGASGLSPGSNRILREAAFIPNYRQRNYMANERFVTPRVPEMRANMTEGRFVPYSNRPNRHFGSRIGGLGSPQEGTPRDFIRQNQKHPSPTSISGDKHPLDVQETTANTK